MKTGIKHLCELLDKLPKDQIYPYISKKNKGRIKLESVVLPNGPVYYKRWNPAKGNRSDQANTETISSKEILRVSMAINEKVPINLDRILGGSYNSRSVLETLMAHTPEFYYCYPGRVEVDVNTTSVKRGHKHLLWLPEKPHKICELNEIDTNYVISEIPTRDAIYEAFTLPSSNNPSDIESGSRHAQIQYAIIKIGQYLNFRTYIARNDQNIIYQNKPFREHESVIVNLSEEALLSSFPESVKEAKYIDCMWFKNCKLMPAVIEVENTTGIRSGLLRMKNFKDTFPPFQTRYLISAPDNQRDKVYRECIKPQFMDLNAKYFPYSAVEELYSFLSSRRIKGITEEFIDSFVEDPHILN